MLVKGARGRWEDMMLRGSCGEGGMNTAAAIHKNMGGSAAPVQGPDFWFVSARWQGRGRIPG